MYDRFLPRSRYNKAAASVVKDSQGYISVCDMHTVINDYW